MAAGRQWYVHPDRSRPEGSDRHDRLRVGPLDRSGANALDFRPTEEERGGLGNLSRDVEWIVPEFSGARLLLESRQMGYDGGYTAVTDSLSEVRPAAPKLKKLKER
jgi:hypothetical protein